ncbi:MAG TPA: amino acid ABC transporter ATP-binding protein [Planctomycetaceae bacterium]|nr:amino acid ABC transporter ATP-binding protein [Planctomycetaceae bacterium]
MLTIEGLTKSHGPRPVLRGVTLALEAGRVGVLIGASGSGKSTVLRCINGLEDFQAGSVTVGGLTHQAGAPQRERLRVLAALRCRVGMVFQQFNLFSHLSVLGNVIEAPIHVLRRPRDAAVAQARELLERVGLGDRLDSRIDQLSGGQQQRVAIARALAMRPELILFDEPTSALDPQMTGEVLAVMTDLARQGQTMLVVTHSMGFARRAAHAVFVIAGGQIVESGPPAEVLDAPRHEQTQQLLREVELG